MITFRITLLGNLKQKLDRKELLKHDSKIFRISGFSEILNIPPSRLDHGTLDNVYDPNDFLEIVTPSETGEIVIGIMNYKFSDNFYMHRINTNVGIISLYEIDFTLLNAGISIERFILKCIYEIATYIEVYGTMNSDQIYELHHRDTRGCLFDLNGDQKDVVYNTDEPIICNECLGKIAARQTKEGFISTLQHELKKLKRPFFLRVESWIKSHPFMAIAISIAMGIATNIIYDIGKLTAIKIYHIRYPEQQQCIPKKFPQ